MGDFHDLKAAIEEEFPGWTIWRSDAGRWYATRSGDLTEAQLRAGCAIGPVGTVAADDFTGLRGLLADQAGGDQVGGDGAG